MRYVLLATLLLSLSIPALGDCQWQSAPNDNDTNHRIWAKLEDGTPDLYQDEDEGGGESHAAVVAADPAFIALSNCSYYKEDHSH